MNLPRKRLVLPAAAAALALGAGGVYWAGSANADVTGSDRDRVARAATDAVSGTATEVERSDDPGEAYEVEVTRADGSQVDVSLDRDLAVVQRETDDRDDARDDDGGRDADDRALRAEERASVERAALAAVGGGTVTEAEASDDRGVAYEAEVLQGTVEWRVDLARDFSVVDKHQDD